MRIAKKRRPRTKPPETRREELMDAAQRLFLERGVDSTTIERITSGAGVAKGTFYLYFSSKEDVLAALGDRFARELLGRIKTAVAEKPKERWKEKLGTWARTAVAGYLDSIRLHDIVFGFDHGPRPPTREGMTDNIVINHLSGLLQGGVDAGAWSIDDAHFTAVFLFSALHGVVDYAYTKEIRLNRSRLADRLERLCFRSVGLQAR
ncbi:MAG: TetR/AcrR family transcriptional regulator [Candidatus Acidiferrales bacterium]